MEDEDTTLKVLTSAQRFTLGTFAFAGTVLGAYLLAVSGGDHVLWSMLAMAILGLSLYYLMRAAYGYDFMSMADITMDPVGAPPASPLERGAPT